MPSRAKMTRKVAKRKNENSNHHNYHQQQEQQQRESPDSPTKPQPHHEEEMDGYYSYSDHLATTDDEDQPKLEPVAAMENPENRRDPGKTPGQVETLTEMEEVGDWDASGEREKLHSNYENKDANESLAEPPPKTEDVETERPPVEEDEQLPEAEDVRLETIDEGRDDGGMESSEQPPSVTVGPTDFAASQSASMSEEAVQAAERQAISTDEAVHTETLSTESGITAVPMHEDQPRDSLGVKDDLGMLVAH